MRDFQDGLAKAINKGDENAQNSMIKKMSRSFDLRALAVRKVLSNKGKRTSGIDKVLWARDSDKIEAINQLSNQKHYHAMPVKRVMIPKANGSLRPLGIPTMADRAMQALWGFILDVYQESSANDRSFGFRKARNAGQAVSYIHSLCSRNRGTMRLVLKCDIEKFYDTINHDWILANIKAIPAHIMREWLKSGVIDNGKFFETEMGTPQGSIISPIISNLVLAGIEELIMTDYTTKKGKRHLNVFPVRYADDLIVIGNDLKSMAVAKRRIEVFLKERGLKLNESKTEILKIEKGFDFLGFTFREYKDNWAKTEFGKKGAFLIHPSRKAIRTFKDKIKSIVKTNKNLKSFVLIGLLNPIIRGWINYFRAASITKIKRTLGKFIWKVVWSWVIRKHKTTGKRALKEKYFTTRKQLKTTNNWTFFGIQPNGTKVHLTNIADFNVWRQKFFAFKGSKTWKGSNPYLLSDILTFHNKIKNLIVNGQIDGVKIKLIIKQNARCAVCDGPFLLDERIETHHLIPKTEGGTDKLSNLRLLHYICHKQIEWKRKQESEKNSETASNIKGKR